MLHLAHADGSDVFQDVHIPSQMASVVTRGEGCFNRIFAYMKHPIMSNDMCQLENQSHRSPQHINKKCAVK